jgi:hypothetical protein
MTKPIVHYSVLWGGVVRVGRKATVLAHDHPNTNIPPFSVVDTSTIVSFDEATGNFETQNTKYVLKELDLR